MNTAEKLTENVLPLADAINQVIASYEKEAVEQNAFDDAFEKLEQENTFLKLQLENKDSKVTEANEGRENAEDELRLIQNKLSTLEKQSQQVIHNAEQNLIQVDQAVREKEQAEIKLKDALLQLKAFKEIANTPKKVRDKIKDLQAKTAERLAAIELHKKDAKKYRQSIEQGVKALSEKTRELEEVKYQTLYEKNGEHIALYPLLCHTRFDESQDMTKQVALLYLNKDGIGALYTLNEEGEVSRAQTPKAGIKPKAETMNTMGTFLRQAERNGGFVDGKDMALLKTGGA